MLVHSVTDTFFVFRANLCKEMVRRDFAVVSVRFGSDKYTRARQSVSATRGEKLAIVGNIPYRVGHK